MSKPLLPSAKFRHVVFPAEADRRKRVINYAAHGEPAALTAEGLSESGLSEEHAAFFHWLFGRAGLDARAYRAETLRRRLPACLRGLHVRTVAQARRQIEQEPDSLTAALSAMLVGVTSFFRDPPVFDLLAKEILPGLIKGRPGLYVWSAGCSEGAELYSLGMLFAELGCLGSSYLLGTDCRPDAVQRARAGLFEPLACKNVPARLLARYFTAEGPRWRVVAPLRAALRWRTADLLQVQEPGVWDLILCRNATMYMRSEATNLLWEKLEGLLRPGGVLVLGKAERPVGVKRLTPVGPCLYRRNRG